MKKCKNTIMKRFLMLFLSIGLSLGFVVLPVCTAAESVVVPENTRMTLQLNTSLSTKDNQEGDDFDAYIIEPVYSEGRIVIPRGSVISGSISRISRPGRFKGKAVMHLLFQSIQIPGRGKLPFSASLVRINTDEDAEIHTEDLEKDIGSAGKNLNAGDTGSGMGFGFTNVFWTRGKDLEIHRGSTMEISLKQDLKIPLKNQPEEQFTIN
ncbi:MAG: hypothetical protein P8Z37_08610 [Acidobacteriota bacterium]